jgi:hypothetical protein
MARLRQQYPQNYGSSGNINTEFESVVRYLNAAELGENTVAELLAKIFDNSGNWIGPVEFQKDSSAGLQYRVGSYTDTTSGWITIASNTEIRGESGVIAGTIGAPIFHQRTDTVVTSGQTVVDYAHDSTDELVVYVDGVLKRAGASFDYQTSPTAGTSSAGAVTFNTTPYVNSTTTVGIYKVRSSAVTGYTRSDTVAGANGQASFPFVHDTDTVLQVYKNGILQRDGGSFDYTTNPANNTVNFNTIVTNGNLITIITVENTSTSAVTGLMMESKFVNSGTGLIDFAKIEIDNDEIPQAKVSGVAASLSGKANITVSSSAPSNPSTGDLWHDTSSAIDVLKFWNGSEFLQTSSESTLPTFISSNATQYIRVNASGTALEYGTLDLSSKISITDKGAANGVATLDSSGKLPSAQLPTVLANDCMYLKVAAPNNANYVIKKVFGQKIQITGLYAATSGGTCSVQPMLGTAAITNSSTYSVGTSGTTNAFSTANFLEIDCSSVARDIGFIVTNDSSAANLEVVISYNIIA